MIVGCKIISLSRCWKCDHVFALYYGNKPISIHAFFQVMYPNYIIEINTVLFLIVCSWCFNVLHCQPCNTISNVVYS